MSVKTSKTQIDRLGDRLKEGSHTESDLRLLEDYRRSFGEAYESVLRTIRQRGEFPTGRLAKSTRSIAEKLRRESIRLSQMQDIAGCRVVVANISKQEQFIASLKADFLGASVIDRRDKPSYGYRAVHIIAMISGKPVEIQVRTSLQHLWAELSEKSSDVLDPTIKYGGGPAAWRRVLTSGSELVAAHEECEEALSEKAAAYQVAAAAHEDFKKAAVEYLEAHPPRNEAQKTRRELKKSTREMERAEQEMQESRKDLVNSWNRTADSLKQAISWLDKQKGKKQ